MDCLFCRIIRDELPASKIYEDDTVIAILDIHPKTRGHALVIPKEHVTNLVETPDELSAKLLPLVRKIAEGVIAGVGAEGFKIAINNGEVADQVVHHLHIHIIPRKTRDDSGYSYEEGEMEEVAEMIRERLI